ncbi:Cyclopentanone 1,2-monooxygenase [Pseudocercospora fuligena]|uniref:Cyclopentanone 1,2-monooxygenase n=1 Tax=Pseudocercospora fuligena TaxID=685502 RepID=A0A8H6RJB1_9PEZI|nr:Cyclopentanone 1,2-monooxygenase [Pseudocercospora fuligena]
MQTEVNMAPRRGLSSQPETLSNGTNGTSSHSSGHPVQLDLDAVIIGGGFAGVYLLHRLRQEGFNVKIVEAGSALGGIWYWNNYPGARVDSQWPVYQLSIQEVFNTFEWKEQYPGSAELQRYFEHTDKVLNISKDTLFHTRVKAATWNDDSHRWHIECDNGTEITSKFMHCCLGFAAKRHFPDWPGFDDFQGYVCHSSFWPKEGIDMRGKRVGVVGNGATGIQIAQESAKDAEHLSVFIRTPNTCIPMNQRPVDPSNRHVYDFWARNVRKRIKDPVKRDILAPVEPLHPFAGKRPSLEQDYYEQMDKDHVDIVYLRETPIEKLVPEGIVTSDGKLHKLDILALATGFDSLTGGFMEIDIKGIDGEVLNQKWSGEQGALSYLGLSVNQFPNMFYTYGPHAPTAYGNGPSIVEPQCEWILKTMQLMAKDGKTKINAQAQAEQEWKKITNDFHAATVRDSVDSWYMGTNIPGKPRQALNYAGGLTRYIDSINGCQEKGFEGFDLS